jgi:ABC-type bacteriocin/lantibiotic exporter with double-glycine peptidase domain
MRVRSLFLAILVCLAGAVLALASPQPGIWIDVPFVAQTMDGCGSASISMVMQYWASKTGLGVPDAADAGRIQKALVVPSQNGIPASAMRGYFEKSGYRAFAFQGTWEDLVHHVKEGRPLIVSLRASAPSRALHYVVVVGIDLERNDVFIHDPAQQKMLQISRQGFESEWNPTHNWTLLAVPRSND